MGAEFHRICRDIFLVQLDTPRQAIRYANALRFALPLLKGEVDPFDQMIVEAGVVRLRRKPEFLRSQSVSLAYNGCPNRWGRPPLPTPQRAG